MLAPPTTLTQLEQAIWRTVAYVDLFDYPLTAVEIHRYLEGVQATQTDVAKSLAESPALLANLSQAGGYFFLPERARVVQIRQSRQKRAQTVWPQAIRYGRFIAQLPFVRMVAVTGSLAMNNVTDDADIDYFIVTENGRLWLSRAFIIGLVRLAAWQGLTLCPNYFVTESALTLPERNIYTAREIVQMAPLFGQAVYQQFRQQNGWTNQFLPNGVGTPAVYLGTVEPRQWPQQIAERPLQTRLGEWLERWERQRKIAKLRHQKNGSNESNFSTTICKGHFNAHQKQILTAYQKQLTNGH
ncbi:hypothetical protein MNBD_CHLOROFLEXI01-279 [hydrothermal vent metagenome]|uniref:Polymerase nucleotidyl transferase domain-containing protein n=1 Tax=hydrothermal vent metagenome TaxID=652676 RepID=A0A3B0UXZ8_9ZZZZ